MSLNKHILKFAYRIQFSSIQFTDSVIEHWIFMCWPVRGLTIKFTNSSR